MDLDLPGDDRPRHDLPAPFEIRRDRILASIGRWIARWTLLAMLRVRQ